MRPAAGLDNAAADKQLVEPGIAVGVDDTAEVLQMRLRMLAFAVGRVEEQCRRWACAAEWPLGAGHRYHSSLLGTEIEFVRPRGMSVNIGLTKVEGRRSPGQ